MSYAFMSIERIKSYSAMGAKYRHNCRRTDLIGKDISNVIAEKSCLNIELVSLPKDADGNEMDYEKAMRQRISEQEYYRDHKIRKNAVLGFEVLMTYSRDDSIDAEQWAKQSVEWLHRQFDRAGDGKSNVLHAVMHRDETGNVHIHAFVVPIDERGHLNADGFTHGSRVMSEMQTSYAKSVENLGIKRGIAGSTAKHKDIQRMYAALNNVVSLDDTLPGETPEEYRDRVLRISKALPKESAEHYRNRVMQKIEENIDVLLPENTPPEKRAEILSKLRKTEPGESAKDYHESIMTALQDVLPEETADEYKKRVEKRIDEIKTQLAAEYREKSDRLIDRRHDVDGLRNRYRKELSDQREEIGKERKKLKKEKADLEKNSRDQDAREDQLDALTEQLFEERQRMEEDRRYANEYRKIQKGIRQISDEGDRDSVMQIQETLIKISSAYERARAAEIKAERTERTSEEPVREQGEEMEL